MAFNKSPSIGQKADQLDKDTDSHQTTVPESLTKTSLQASVASAPTSFATLEPHQPAIRGKGGVTNRGRNNRRPHQQYKEQLALSQFSTPDFKKFFVIKPYEDINLWKTVDTIKANRELENYIKGPPNRVTELKNGSLLVEVKTKEQANKIKAIKQINKVKVTVIEHSSLNYTKGTIRCKRFIDVPDETLIEEMKEYKVIDIYKIKRKEQNDLVCTGTIILTFDTCTLPSQIKIGWKIFEVREYIPFPRRCFKCQAFGHSSKSCHAQEAICANCGDPQHGPECYSPPHCCNCEEPHRASDKNCFYYKLESEVLATKTKEKISYSAAKRRVLKDFVKPMTSYAQALKVNIDSRTERNNKHAPNQGVVGNQIPINDASKKEQQSRDTQTLGTVLEKQTQDQKKQTDSNLSNESETLKRIPTILTTLSDMEDTNNRKRNISQDNNRDNQQKFAKITPEAQQAAGTSGVGVPRRPASASGEVAHSQRTGGATGAYTAPQQANNAQIAQMQRPVPQHTQPPLAISGAAAVSGVGGALHQSNMEVDNFISPSPVLHTRPHRERSSSKDRKSNNQDRRKV